MVRVSIPLSAEVAGFIARTQGLQRPPITESREPVVVPPPALAEFPGRRYPFPSTDPILVSQRPVARLSAGTIPGHEAQQSG